MSRHRIKLLSAVFTLAFVSAVAAQSSNQVQAGECLTKPTGPAPEGQHWYYRTDRETGRQCWHLAAEDGSDEKYVPRNESQAAPKTTTQSQPKRADSPALTKPKSILDPVAAAPAPAANSPWPSAPPMIPAPPPPATTISTPSASAPAMSAPPAPVQSPPVQFSTPTDTAQSASAPAESATTTAATASANNGTQLQAIDHAQTGAEVRKPAVIIDLLAALKSRIGDFDHVVASLQRISADTHIVAILMIVFAVLAVSGPILHYAGRRRRRRALAVQPPRWARVVPPLALPSSSDPKPARNARGEPDTAPLVPIDHTEILAHTLQRLADQLHMQEASAPSIAASPIDELHEERIRRLA